MDVACGNRCGNGNNGILSLELDEIMVQEVRTGCSNTTTNITYLTQDQALTNTDTGGNRLAEVPVATLNTFQIEVQPTCVQPTVPGERCLTNSELNRMASNANTGNHTVHVHGPPIRPSASLTVPSPQGPDCDPPSYHEVTMETRAPIQSDSDTLRDGIENESFDRNTSNAENDLSSQTTNQYSASASEQNRTHHENEHISDSEDGRESDLGRHHSQASDSISSYSNDPKTTIEITTINIPVQDRDSNHSQAENLSNV